MCRDHVCGQHRPQARSDRDKVDGFAVSDEVGHQHGIHRAPVSRHDRCRSDRLVVEFHQGEFDLRALDAEAAHLDLGVHTPQVDQVAGG